MKILVFSDSHSSLRFMFRCVEKLKPDALIHLGDYHGDAVTLWMEYRDIPLYSVQGNCDGYRLDPGQYWTRIEELGGVTVYMTHGHQQKVKQTLAPLLRDARASKAQIVLFGHTHQALCRQEEDGLWVMNPGSAGFIASCGVIEAEAGEITDIRILREAEMLD